MTASRKTKISTSTMTRSGKSAGERNDLVDPSQDLATPGDHLADANQDHHEERSKLRDHPRCQNTSAPRDHPTVIQPKPPS